MPGASAVGIQGEGDVSLRRAREGGGSYRWTEITATSHTRGPRRPEGLAQGDIAKTGPTRDLAGPPTGQVIGTAPQWVERAARWGAMGTEGGGGEMARPPAQPNVRRLHRNYTDSDY